MSIEIKKLTDCNYTVGKKHVIKDMNGNWIAVTELSQAEIEAFQNLLNAKNEADD